MTVAASSGELDGAVRVAKFRYDFGLQGGAISTITLPELLPKGAIVTQGKIFVEEALTSGGSATIGLYLLTAGDVKTDTAVATYALNAVLDIVPVDTAATALRMTAATGLKVIIKVAALLTGKMSVHLQYYMP